MEYEPTTLTALPLRERPASRVSSDPTSCNLIELLAAVIRGKHQIEAAERLLGYYAGDIERLYHASVAELAAVRGISQEAAAAIQAGLALGLRLCSSGNDDRQVINSPADAAALVMSEMSLLEQEYFKVMLLDARGRLMEILEVYHGNVHSCTIRAAEVFKSAVQRNSPTILCVHNHPSGDSTPSPEDIAVTRTLTQAGKLLDITLQDHIIIGKGNHFTSLKERGFL